MHPSALQVDPGFARLAELEAELARREQELTSVKIDLQRLQVRYLDEVGAFYEELSALEAAIDEEEIRRGIRPPASDEAADAGVGPDTPLPGGCANPAAASGDLKRMFRDVAKAIHPDLALDEPARCRRHSLMAEANRAYAERDEDRLRLILSAWERNPEWTAASDGLPDEDVGHRMARIDARLIAIEAEFADLRRSAIWRLKGKIDEARAQGWDLFSEMLLQVRREIARAKARLATLR